MTSASFREALLRVIETLIMSHPLVRYHGVSSNHMDLIRTHQLVEAGHRHDAYTIVTEHAVTAAVQQAILAALKTSVRLWLAYRDGVANACGGKKRL